MSSQLEKCAQGNNDPTFYKICERCDAYQHQMLYLHDHKGITVLQKLLLCTRSNKSNASENIAEKIDFSGGQVTQLLKGWSQREGTASEFRQRE